jgi:DNA replication protein DnaC
LFQVITKRDERGSIITNLSFSDWAGALADDATLSAARLDRLLHHGHIVTCRGDSYRLKDKRKAGMTANRKRERAV